MRKLCPAHDETSVMRSICNDYYLREFAYQDKEQALKRSIEKREASIQKRQEEIYRRQEKLKEMNSTHPDWIKSLVVPLADIIAEKLAFDLKKETPLPYKIWGPSGLSARVMVSFFPMGEDNIALGAEHYTLTVVPRLFEMNCKTLAEKTGSYQLRYAAPETVNASLIRLEYETGAIGDNPCPPGSIGRLNGLDLETEPLPERLGEIMKLLRHVPAKES